ncbi:transporter substrate-binding domain-containing protein [Candidatus Venteria ishoeyi]|uniref:substrate-binding periplasmic protein n=1 Tax=Candidatus Venteria ishoeyi TaxID=1899563 RepID=UPI0025A4EFD0|nr:transporter substrate-binding domain-containing protein [Candidatus Venteria ishoeyi]MDM8545445.1 transporter substrate-binding domain-containing protein [Candidatus Venteria ishoeyi]
MYFFHCSLIRHLFFITGLISLLLITMIVSGDKAQAAPVLFKNPITLVTGNHYAPFADSSLSGGGMSVEVVKAAFNAVGRRAYVAFMPWRRGFIGVQRRSYAGTFPHFRSAELAEEFYFSDSLYPIQQRIYVSAGSKIDFNTLDDLTSYRLCSPIGHTIDKGLQKRIDTAAISVISPSSTKLCAKMLEKNRVDFMALDETVYRYMFKGFKLKAVGRPLQRADLFLLLPKQDPESKTLLQEFNAGLAVIKKSGQFDKIVKRHLKYP